MALVYPLPWPAILIPSSESWNLNKGASRGGGRSSENMEQTVSGPTGYAVASLTVPCNTTDKVLEMRALLLGLDGRAGTVLVGPNEVRRAPWFRDPFTGSAITYGRAAREAARDPAWGSNPDTGGTLDFRLGADAAMNATHLTIQRNRGGLLRRGQMFSIGNRLHAIVALDADDTGGAGAIGVTIRPWLRADYVLGTVLEFGRPLGTMKLATDDTGALELQLARSGTATLDLVEAF